MNKSEKIKQIIQKPLTDALLLEWERQGHFMSGAAVKNIKWLIKEYLDTINIDLYIPDYYYYQDRGVRSERIPYSRGSGRGKSDYISGLIKFAKARMYLNLKEATSVAFAIAETHKKEGMPSTGSYKWSHNNKRTRAVSGVIDEKGTYLSNLIMDRIWDVLEVEFNSMVDKQIRKFKRL